ncbi:PAS domain-containing sensor histidine kinase [Pullulanibacillus camelliae]|uniref:histidine kinase n=1 Tax=Pullulanibacillus camelliae TaxID=1707096 RepID=A0A8J3DWS5_9BACL|nr:HAMP domain-containing sensor histidine kinase [Pullulanibacillus camelliae]GGE47004.1 PAS domain-containing sensor histidine kinase [Pullulanibacillus camelliae]
MEGGTIVYPMLTNNSTYNEVFEEITYEVRLLLSVDGEILKVNQRGMKLLEQNGKYFYDHCIPSHRHSLLQMLHELTKGNSLIEKRFHLKTEGQIKEYSFRGRSAAEGIYLVGLETHHSLKQSSFDRLESIAESIFNALNIAVFILDRHNNVIYYNDVLKKEGRFRRNFTKLGGRPIIRVMKEMAADIRQSSKDVRRYHLYDKTLYRVYGIYNNHTDMITFIIDDRAGSDEYDNLLLYKQQMESVSHLAAGFAHELRNPLSVIRGFIQLSALTDDIEKYYKTILSELDRMNDIIDDFLSLSRKAPEREAQQPYEFFQSIVSLIRSECLLRNIKLVHDFQRVSAQLLLNRSMIKQVFLNVLRNAIEAFDDNQTDKRFSLKGRVVDKYYVITVEDNGPGMEREVLDQLGKPFFTTKEKGTGIGLPLCKKIIQEHNGHFEISSELGSGTTIKISLPLEQTL